MTSPYVAMLIQITMHDALSALINLTDSPLVALRIADPEFLKFLVAYIGVRCRADAGLGVALGRPGLHAPLEPDQV